MTPAASMTQRRTLEDLSTRVFGEWPVNVAIRDLNQIEASDLIRQLSDLLSQHLLLVPIKPTVAMLADLEDCLEDRKEEPMPKTKECTKCGKQKPLSQFHKRSASADGYHYYCKQCVKDLRRERLESDKPEPKPEPKFLPPDENEHAVDLRGDGHDNFALAAPDGEDGNHWCISELRDPRLSTIVQAQKILAAKFEGVGLEDTVEVLQQFADLDLT